MEMARRWHGRLWKVRAPVWAGENDGTKGLLFELIDPADESELEQLLCSGALIAIEPRAVVARAAEVPGLISCCTASSSAVGGALAATSSLAFVHPDGTRHRMQLQVVRLQPLSSRDTPASSRDASLQSSQQGSRDGSTHGSRQASPKVPRRAWRDESTPPPHEPLSLFVVCHDLSNALRQCAVGVPTRAPRTTTTLPASRHDAGCWLLRWVGWTPSGIQPINYS